MGDLHNAWAGLSEGAAEPPVVQRKPIYENEVYAVKIRAGGLGYNVVNKITNVVEAQIDKLPSAITTADVTRDVLKRILDEKETSEATD